MIRVLTVIAGCVLAVSATTSAQSRSPIVSAVDVQAGPAPMPVAIAGRQHLAYELHVTNFTRSEITLTRVEVLEAARGTVVGEFSGEALSSRVAHAGVRRGDGDMRAIAPGMRAIVYLWLPFDAGVPVPSGLRHRLGVEVVRADQRLPILVTGAEVEVRSERPLTLSPPLGGGPWVALYDPLLMGGHRTAVYAVDGRARIPARFAIDFVRLEHDGTHARGDRARIANWHGYGAEVLAVADATVIEAKDDIAEAPTIAAGPHPAIPLENASGNHVSLDLGGGRYAFYEHLKQGSIRVKSGDRVRAGDVIGMLGNSGSSSSGPHLHFHVADASAELAGEGVPYVFDGFESLGAFATIDAFTAGGRWKPMRAGEGGVRKNELPAANSVVVFAGRSSTDFGGSEREDPMTLAGKTLTRE